ncbi:phage holin family protein [Siminovitchia sediminis]|uniref:Phage holin family protein n=1 Tax=Siminovitchia sediminis TaxID=1274353 RepID=A0ABW4KHC5_9BACI
MRWLTGILINAALFLAFAGYFEGFHVSSFGAAAGASLVLSILNMLVRPILILLTLPITILTLGFFLLVINAITLSLTDAIMGSSFDIDGFGLALLIAVIMVLINLIIQKTILNDDRKK